MSESLAASRQFFVAPARGKHLPQKEHAAVVQTPFAMVGIRIEGEAVVGIDYLPMHYRAFLSANPLAREVERQIHAYIGNARHAFDVPFAAAGTAHQHAVWRAISEIPSGATRTYGELSAHLRSSPRAVGAACGSNPIPLLVPCHRVVSADGRLGGFMHSRDPFPLSIKRWLLHHEMR